jgi:hypothetical protein
VLHKQKITQKPSRTTKTTNFKPFPPNDHVLFTFTKEVKNLKPSEIKDAKTGVQKTEPKICELPTLSAGVPLIACHSGLIKLADFPRQIPPLTFGFEHPDQTK